MKSEKESIDVFDIDYYERLRADYYAHGSLIVAFDFDNTVYDYHKRGVNYDKIIELIRVCKDLGFMIILFTCSEGPKLEKVVENLRARNIPFDYINESPIMKTRKPYYNILLDDRAGLKESYTHLKKLIDEIRHPKI